MTTWTHEEVGHLYRRAERAEDALLELTTTLLRGEVVHGPLERARAVLNQCPRTSIREETAKAVAQNERASAASRPGPLPIGVRGLED